MLSCLVSLHYNAANASAFMKLTVSIVWRHCAVVSSAKRAASAALIAASARAICARWSGMGIMSACVLWISWSLLAARLATRI